MLDKSWQVILASAFGALTGAVVSLSYDPDPRWAGLAALVGGAIGWFSYDPKAVLTTFLRLSAELLHGLNRANFLKGIKSAIFVLIGVVRGFAILVVVLVLPVTVGWAINPWLLKGEDRNGWEVCLENFALFLLVLSFAASLFASLFTSIEGWRTRPFVIVNIVGFLLVPIIRLWLPQVLLVTCGLIGLGLAAVLLWLVWRTVVIVHSNERMICLFGAAVGAAIGHLLKAPIAGAVVGGLIGFTESRLVIPALRSALSGTRRR